MFGSPPLPRFLTSMSTPATPTPFASTTLPVIVSARAGRSRARRRIANGAAKWILMVAVAAEPSTFPSARCSMRDAQAECRRPDHRGKGNAHSRVQGNRSRIHEPDLTRSSYAAPDQGDPAPAVEADFEPEILPRHRAAGLEREEPRAAPRNVLRRAPIDRSARVALRARAQPVAAPRRDPIRP